MRASKDKNDTDNPGHYICRQLFPGIVCLFILKGLGQVACSDANFQEMNVHRRVAVWVERLRMQVTEFGFNAVCNNCL